MYIYTQYKHVYECAVACVVVKLVHKYTMHTDGERIVLSTATNDDDDEQSS